MTDLPPPVAEAFAATNAGDLGRFVAAFADDGVIDDWGREFRGARGDRRAGAAASRSACSRPSRSPTCATATTIASVVVLADVGGGGFNGPSTFTFRLGARRRGHRAHDDHGMSDASAPQAPLGWAPTRRARRPGDDGLVVDPGDPATVRSARSFGAAASVYHQVRPGYPVEAIAWLIGDAVRVLDLGAGTGKLTEALVALDRDVIAVDPVEEMLEELEVAVPGVPRILGTAEDIPIEDASVDAVVAGQAWHWFQPERAVPEIARVLRPGGVLGLVWNSRDTVRRLASPGRRDHARAPRRERHVRELRAGRAAVRRDRGAHGRVGRADVARAVPRPRAVAQLLHHRDARPSRRRRSPRSRRCSRRIPTWPAPRSSRCRTSRAASAPAWLTAGRAACRTPRHGAQTRVRHPLVAALRLQQVGGRAQDRDDRGGPPVGCRRRRGRSRRGRGTVGRCAAGATAAARRAPRVRRRARAASTDALAGAEQDAPAEHLARRGTRASAGGSAPNSSSTEREEVAVRHAADARGEERQRRAGEVALAVRLPRDLGRAARAEQDLAAHAGGPRRGRRRSPPTRARARSRHPAPDPGSADAGADAAVGAVRRLVLAGELDRARGSASPIGVRSTRGARFAEPEWQLSKNAVRLTPSGITSQMRARSSSMMSRPVPRKSTGQSASSSDSSPSSSSPSRSGTNVPWPEYCTASTSPGAAPLTSSRMPREDRVAGGRGIRQLGHVEPLAAQTPRPRRARRRRSPAGGRPRRGTRRRRCRAHAARPCRRCGGAGRAGHVAEREPAVAAAGPRTRATRRGARPPLTGTGSRRLTPATRRATLSIVGRVVVEGAVRRSPCSRRAARRRAGRARARPWGRGP